MPVFQERRATYSRVDVDAPDQKLGSQLASTVFFSGKGSITVLYPISDRGFVPCSIDLDERTPENGRPGVHGVLNCRDRLPELHGKEFDVPYELAKKWTLFPNVLAFVRLDPVHGGGLRLGRRGWKVSVQAGPFTPPQVPDNVKSKQAALTPATPTQ